MDEIPAQVQRFLRENQAELLEMEDAGNNNGDDSLNGGVAMNGSGSDGSAKTIEECDLVRCVETRGTSTVLVLL